MKLKESALVLSLVALVSVFGCGSSGQHRRAGDSSYQTGDYQNEVQRMEWRRAQEGKGKWAGQYKSGKSVGRIPIQPGYNGYRSLIRGIKKGRH